MNEEREKWRVGGMDGGRDREGKVGGGKVGGGGKRERGRIENGRKMYPTTFITRGNSLVSGQKG